jgi:hypothetical protein
MSAFWLYLHVYTHVAVTAPPRGAANYFLVEGLPGMVPLHPDTTPVCPALLPLHMPARSSFFYLCLGVNHRHYPFFAAAKGSAGSACRTPGAGALEGVARLIQYASYGGGSQSSHLSPFLAQRSATNVPMWTMTRWQCRPDGGLVGFVPSVRCGHVPHCHR